MNIVRWSALAFAALTLLCFPPRIFSQETNSPWAVPKNPNPAAILREAETDKTAGRYKDALAKHVWFHENALKIQPAQYGVRLSFALSDWIELGNSYPPALEKLKSIRDNDEKKIRESRAPRDSFHDFEAINEYLKDINRTRDMFIWLDTNAPVFAKEVFDLAEPDLIKTKEYHLCGKYLLPDVSFEKIRDAYQENSEIAKNPRFGKRLSDYGEKSFSNKSATLVALLAVNGRTKEADEVAAKSETVLNNPEFKSLLEKAKKGDVPAPWP